MLSPSEKACCKCRVVKPAADFNRSSKAATGLQSYCRICKNIAIAAWMKKNPEKNRIKSRAWRRRNPEKHYAQNEEYRKAHPEKHNAKSKKSYAAKRRSIPKWANLLLIEGVYRLAALKTRTTGSVWHVDHIVPLQSKVVCGLHVENNLMVIPAKDNHLKGNRHWPDMP